ncbi:hypothetical protein FACS189474_2830 [Bacteroidia bacterium]|nr:hypothetical protein FACS189474_2830 [Bacteroidia bacterium]
MKKVVLTIVVFLCVFGAKAQEFSVGADVVSSYVWRGQYLGGASIQPGVGFSAGGFSIGAWGSTDIVNLASAKEFDLSVGYEISGFSVGITDYWIVPQDENRSRYFNYDKDNGTAHTFEATIGYTLPVESFPLSLSWSTNFAGTDGVKLDGEEEKTAYSSYFEASYPFSVKDIALTAAIGLTPWETSAYGANGFSVLNISLAAAKEIKITDSFSLPVFGQIVVNPRSEDAFLVIGISF